MPLLNKTVIDKFDAILSRGLCRGVGNPDGQMCVEAVTFSNLKTSLLSGETKMETTWTISAVKEELPEVQVLVASRIILGQVYGRAQKFASVLLPDGGSFEFAWETIVHSLNTGRPLRI